MVGVDEIRCRACNTGVTRILGKQQKLISEMDATENPESPSSAAHLCLLLLLLVLQQEISQLRQILFVNTQGLK